MRTAALAVCILLLLAGGLRADESTPTLDSARALAHRGRLPAAIEQARVLVRSEPGHADAARLLQDLLRAAGKLEEARALAREEAPALVRQGLEARLMADPKKAVAALGDLLKKDGAATVFRLDLALALCEAGRASQGESEAARYLKERPEDAEGLATLGRIQKIRGRNVAARTTLERVLGAHPGLPAPAVALAQVHAAEGRDEEARAVLTQALDVYAENPQLLTALAEDQVRMREFEPALATLSRRLALEGPKTPVHVRMAEVHRLRKAWPEAERCAAAALTLEPENVRALRVRGFVKQKRDDLVGALKDYRRAQELAPGWAPVQADIGFVLMLQGETLEAEKVVKKALDLDDELLESHLVMGMILYLRNKPKLAKKELAWVLKRDEENLRAHRTMGYLLLQEGKPKNALRSFETVAALDPKDSSSVRMMGRAHLAMGRIEDAVAAFQEAIARNGKDGFSYFDLGKAFEQQERWEDAAAAYRKSVSLDAKLPHPHLYLAELLDEILDEPEEALEHYKAYLEAGGDSEGGWIKKRIEALERELDEKKKK